MLEAAGLLLPAFSELLRQAAQGRLLHNDDTPMQILDRASLVFKKGRKTVQTSAIANAAVVDENLSPTLSLSADKVIQVRHDGKFEAPGALPGVRVSRGRRPCQDGWILSWS